MSLEPLNHAPLALTADVFHRHLQRHLLELRLRHATLHDPLTGRRRSIDTLLVPLTEAGVAHVEIGAARPGEREAAEGGADIGVATRLVVGRALRFDRGAADCRLVFEACQKAHTANALQDDPGRRKHIALLATGGVACGKSTFLRQLAMHAAAVHADLVAAASSSTMAADTEGVTASALIPLLVHVPSLAHALRANPNALRGSWNYVDGYLKQLHGAARYAMLRQAMMARRCLLLLDGLDEGGAIDNDHRHMLVHVLEVLVPQGHAIVATARREGPLQREWTAAGLACLHVSSLPTPLQRQFLQRVVPDDVAAAEQLPRFEQSSGPPPDAHSEAVRPAPMACPLMLATLASLRDRPLLPQPDAASANGGADSADGGGADGGGCARDGAGEGPAARPPANLGALINSAVDGMLTVGDKLEHADALPPVHAQRGALMLIALCAHARGSRAISEPEIHEVLAGGDEAVLHREAWGHMRQKLARGMLPVLSVTCSQPLEVCLADLCLQEYLAMQAICCGHWPAAVPQPWAWGRWWRGVSGFGNTPAWRQAFGAALLAASRAVDIKLEAVSGDPRAVADAIVPMMDAAASKKAHGTGLRLRCEGHSDVMADSDALAVEPGERRLMSFQLGGLPHAAFGVLVHVLTAALTAAPSTTALDLSKNALGAAHAKDLAQAVALSQIGRINLERNSLGAEGVGIFCGILARAPSSNLIDLDLSHNDIAGVPSAVEAIAMLLRNGALQRLALTSNPIGITGGVDGAKMPAVDGMKSLCQALTVNTTLRELWRPCSARPAPPASLSLYLSHPSLFRTPLSFSDSPSPYFIPARSPLVSAPLLSTDAPYFPHDVSTLPPPPFLPSHLPYRRAAAA